MFVSSAQARRLWREAGALGVLPPLTRPSRTSRCSADRPAQTEDLRVQAYASSKYSAEVFLWMSYSSTISRPTRQTNTSQHNHHFPICIPGVYCISVIYAFCMLQSNIPERSIPKHLPAYHIINCAFRLLCIAHPPKSHLSCTREPTFTTFHPPPAGVF